MYALHGGSPIQGRLFSLIDSKCYPCLSALPCWEFSYLVRGADRAQQQLSDEMYSGVVKESVLMLPKLQAKTAAQHLWCLSRLRQNRPLPQEVVEAASAPMIKVLSVSESRFIPIQSIQSIHQTSLRLQFQIILPKKSKHGIERLIYNTRKEACSISACIVREIQ